MKKKMLITGGHGDIAHCLADVFGEEFDVYAPGRDVLDVTDSLNVKLYIEKLKPDVVINCAGYINPGSVKDCGVNGWVSEVEVNLLGCFYVSHYALKQGCSCIINIGSSAGTKGKAGWSGYCASKRGVVSLTESLCNEGVCCFCVSPGRTQTKMRSMLFPEEDTSTLLPPSIFANVVFILYQNRGSICGCDVVVKQKPDGGVGLYRSRIVLEELKDDL